MSGLKKNSVILKLINRGPNKVWGVGQNRKINKRGRLFGT